MVRTGGIVLSIGLLSLCLTLCGCGGLAPTPAPAPPPAPTPAPTRAPTPAPIGPEEAWQRYKTAFQINDVEALVAWQIYTRPSKSFHYDTRWPVESPNNRTFWPSSMSKVCAACVFNRTTVPVIHSEAFDVFPAMPEDYRIGTLAWTAKWKGPTGVVADMFGVDFMVFERFRKEGWRLSALMQVVDNPASQDEYPLRPECSTTSTGSRHIMQKVCEKDLDGTVALFNDSAVIRSFDKDRAGDSTVNGLFSKDQFEAFFTATTLLETEFPPSDAVTTSGWSGNMVAPIPGSTLRLELGPGINAFTKYPRRYASFTVSDSIDRVMNYQYLARWNWADVVAGRATSHEEHI